MYIDDLLRQLPAVKAYADDLTISISFCHHESHHAVANINRQLKVAEEWGKVWQVIFPQDKTDAMVVSRSPAASQAVERQLGEQQLSLQEHIKSPWTVSYAMTPTPSLKPASPQSVCQLSLE